MIDLDTEHLIDFRHAAKTNLLQNRRTGSPCHVSQIFRYAQCGARAVNGDRVRLETVKTPSGMMTSTEAISRFIRRLTPADRQRHRAHAEPASSTDRDCPGGTRIMWNVDLIHTAVDQQIKVAGRGSQLRPAKDHYYADSIISPEKEND